MSVPVIDPFGVAGDAKMPFVAAALRPGKVEECLATCCASLVDDPGTLTVRGIRVVRHKPGRRCQIEYEVECDSSEPPTKIFTLLGKVRAKGLDKTTWEITRALWRASFGENSADGISVPRPVGVIPEFQMWLQWKVPGLPATELLLKPEGVALAARMAEAAHKLHQAGVPTPRTHTMADEVRILHERLPLIAEMKPGLRPRLERLLEKCDRLGAAVPEPRACGIHRDFYPAQVLVDGARLWVTDLDMYCVGDPAIDVGNFLGHIVEQSVRSSGDAAALRDREQALEERFVELEGERQRAPARAYATLTLVRHIYLSTQFPERRRFSETLLALCEERLAPY